MHANMQEEVLAKLASFGAVELVRTGLKIMPEVRAIICERYKNNRRTHRGLAQRQRYAVDSKQACHGNS